MESSMNLDQIAAEVGRLSDIEALRQLKAKHVRLVDAKEWAQWGEEVLSEDFVLHGDGGVTEGRDAVVAMVSRNLAEAVSVHRLHTPEIEITGASSATGIWPVDDYVTGTFGGKSMVIRGHGRYHEEYVRTGQGWRIRRSRLVRQIVDMSAAPSEPVGTE
jgi:hypothetical protein